MNREYPHEIKRFADGEPIPAGYVELTEEEFQELDKMAAASRARWLEEHGKLTPVEKLRREINAAEGPGDLSAGSMREVDRRLSEIRQTPPVQPPPAMRRDHRRQSR